MDLVVEEARWGGGREGKGGWGGGCEVGEGNKKWKWARMVGMKVRFKG
jgi:hypothetical protein